MLQLRKELFEHAQQPETICKLLNTPENRVQIGLEDPRLPVTDRHVEEVQKKTSQYRTKLSRQRKQEPITASGDGIDTIAATLASFYSPKGNNKNFLMEPEHVAVAADYLKSCIVIYILDPVNPLNDNIYQPSEELKMWSGRTLFGCLSLCSMAEVVN